MLAYWIVAIVLLQFCSLNGVSGDLTVTLMVFSSVPDPKWTISSNHKDNTEIQTHLSAAIKNDLAYHPEDMPSILGYKGILVEPNTKKKSVRLIVGLETVKLQTMLFNTMPKDALPADLREEISKMIASGVVKRQVAPKRTKRYAPPYGTYQLLHLQDLLGIQSRNNCYNYATTIRTDTFALPGRATGLLPYPPVDGIRVEYSAMRDGLVPLNVNLGGPVPVNPHLPDQNHVVALVVWPGTDAHWYRLDDDGTWSHKPGQTAITRWDNAGDLIYDPRDAAKGPYVWVDFMTCNRNTVNII